MYFIERNEVFMNNGRVHSYEESKQIDDQIKTLLRKHDIPYVTYKNNEAADNIVSEVIKELVESGIM